MRLIKMLGLTAVAALASMAFVGATSASADQLCEEGLPPTGTCPQHQLVVPNALLLGLNVGEVKLLSPKGTSLISCAKSETLKRYLGSEGPHNGILGEVTKQLFTTCKGACEKGHGFNFPYLFLGLAAQLHILVSKGVGSAGPPAMEFNNCIGQNCKFQINPEIALLKITGDTIVANEVSLKQTTKCLFSPENAWWDATYLWELDHVPFLPVWITLL